MTFVELADMWYLQKLSEGLCYAYQKELQNSINHLNAFISDRCIDEIKPLDIDRIIISRANFNPNTHKGMSKKCLKDLLNTAKAIFDFAIDNDFIIKNPARNRKIPKNASQHKRRALTDEEQQLIIKTQHRCKIASMLMMFCGLRLGELLALQWSDIDFTDDTIYIRKKMQRTGTNQFTVAPGTKNGKCRKVPIPDKLLEYLKGEKSKAQSIIVCPNKIGELQTPSSWASLWKSYIIALNLEYSQTTQNKFDPKGVPMLLDKITPHMLRHTYTTLLYKSGVDVLVASKLLGHSSVQITLDIYTHLDEEHAQRNISSLNNYIQSNFFNFGS